MYGRSFSFLKIVSCTFALWKATEDAGDAVYVCSISTVDVQDSLCYYSTCKWTKPIECAARVILISGSNAKVSLFTFTFSYEYSFGEAGAIAVTGRTALVSELCSFLSCVGSYITYDRSVGEEIMTRMLFGTVSLGYSCFIPCRTSADSGAISFFKYTLISMGQKMGCNNRRWITCHCNTGSVTPTCRAHYAYSAECVFCFSNCLFAPFATSHHCVALYVYSTDKLDSEIITYKKLEWCILRKCPF